MGTLIVPSISRAEVEGNRWPTLGDQVINFIEKWCVYGPGSLKGEQAQLNADQKTLILRAYEHFPRDHPRAGRRRFQRVNWSVRKGSAKTETMAWIAFAELHPEAPVRFNGYLPDGTLAPGRAVRDPYIPLLAATQEQVAELAYGALMVMCEEHPEYFDVSLERIIRIGMDGRPDGKAVPIAGAPSARDGARTTFNGFDETHRLYLPNHKSAIATMNANLPKRPMEDPWSMSTTTAGQPGQGSQAEDDYREAEAIDRGQVERPSLFFMHRQASDGYDLSDFDQRVEAVREASGPDVAEWSDLEGIAAQWENPQVDKSLLERLWLNRWTQSDAQAFNLAAWEAAELRTDDDEPEKIRRGARVTVGFDGARRRDATAFVLTDIKTGFQEIAGLWERPLMLAESEEWEVPEEEVTAKLLEIMRTYRVQRVYCDPPYWNSTVGEWAARWPDKVEEWWTNRTRYMVKAVSEYADAIATGKVSHGGDPDLTRHIGNAGKHKTNLTDVDTGEKLHILGKMHPDRKFDAAMAGCLSWRARTDLLTKPSKDERKKAARGKGRVARIR